MRGRMQNTPRKTVVKQFITTKYIVNTNKNNHTQGDYTKHSQNSC
jgi:hypothetical protein